MSNTRLLPVGSHRLEVAAARAPALRLRKYSVPLRRLWALTDCPAICCRGWLGSVFS